MQKHHGVVRLGNFILEYSRSSRRVIQPSLELGVAVRPVCLLSSHKATLAIEDNLLKVVCASIEGWHEIFS